ncbi:hypothetical protein AGMMS49950_11150 [Endomicrobiia bacterium]|nr:hypothetical protein AGMMS49531_11110 [Endomicrobiia bacterium]GHT72642.1 hypothetical protein AGMMS49950_11150 [Endomicrobiia bacterium]
MYLNNDLNLFCSTIERDSKSGMLIEAKKYKVILTQSNRFGRLLPLLLNVPDHEGIRIHACNTYKGSTGCILVGNLEGKDFVANSRVTERKIVDLMKEATDIFLNIIA